MRLTYILKTMNYNYKTIICKTVMPATIQPPGATPWQEQQVPQLLNPPHPKSLRFWSDVSTIKPFGTKHLIHKKTVQKIKFLNKCLKL